MTEIVLIRHGETAHNRDGRGLGRQDLPLNETGAKQAAAVAARFGSVTVDRLLTSPLARAMDVARPIGAVTGRDPEVRPELTELDVGETEGMPFQEMREKFPEFLREWGGENAASVRMPGGESLADLGVRLAPLVEELQAAEAGLVVVVTHNFVIKTLLCMFLGLPLGQFRSFGIDLGSVTRLSVRDGGATVRALNDRCHLSP